MEFNFDSGDLCHIITFLSTESALKPKVLNIYSLVRDASTFVVLFFNFKVICSLFSGILCILCFGADDLSALVNFGKTFNKYFLS